MLVRPFRYRPESRRVDREERRLLRHRLCRRALHWRKAGGRQVLFLVLHHVPRDACLAGHEAAGDADGQEAEGVRALSLQPAALPEALPPEDDRAACGDHRHAVLWRLLEHLRHQLPLHEDGHGLWPGRGRQLRHGRGCLADRKRRDHAEAAAELRPEGGNSGREHHLGRGHGPAGHLAQRRPAGHGSGGHGGRRPQPLRRRGRLPAEARAGAGHGRRGDHRRAGQPHGSHQGRRPDPLRQPLRLGDVGRLPDPGPAVFPHRGHGGLSADGLL
mmetsp:Transcript_112084/g.317077  ORF Transcript_112084/g.317077 Transcript_112084/m.317077 type:complete len:273 (+) Transcript_112084:198-1016(+)